MKGEYRGYIKQLGKDLSRHGIHFVSGSNHLIFKGEVNGEQITIFCSCSPKNVQHAKENIAKDVRRKLKRVGAKPHRKTKCFSRGVNLSQIDQNITKKSNCYK